MSSVFSTQRAIRICCGHSTPFLQRGQGPAIQAKQQHLSYGAIENSLQEEHGGPAGGLFESEVDGSLPFPFRCAGDDAKDALHENNESMGSYDLFGAALTTDSAFSRGNQALFENFSRCVHTYHGGPCLVHGHDGERHPPSGFDYLELPENNVFVNMDYEDKGIFMVVVRSGSVLQNGQQWDWEEARFPFHVAAKDEILEAIQDRTLLKLEPRDRGDHSLVLVIDSDDIRRHLWQVKTNAHEFDERPLVEPHEPVCTSVLRMYEYIQMLCVGGICLRDAAVLARLYFGSATFDSWFSSYRHCADSVPFGGNHGARVVADDINEIYEIACIMNEIAGNDGLISCVHCRFGGCHPGPYASMFGEYCAIQNARAYSRRCDGALEMMSFPSHPGEVFIAHVGQLYRVGLDQVRAAAWGFSRTEVGTVANGFEIISVNMFLNGTVSYGVWKVGSEDDQGGVNELQTKCNHQLFP